jgi:predicted DNA binding CopG/RHH family protein
MRDFVMREHYDFSDSTPNPYAKKLKKQITIRLDEDVITYFKSLSEKNGIPYQNLINLYLKDCATANKELQLKWQ